MLVVRFFEFETMWGLDTDEQAQEPCTAVNFKLDNNVHTFASFAEQDGSFERFDENIFSAYSM